MWRCRHDHKFIGIAVVSPPMEKFRRRLALSPAAVVFSKWPILYRIVAIPQHKQDKEYFRCVGSFGAELKNLLFGLLPNRPPSVRLLNKHANQDGNLKFGVIRPII